MRSNGFGRLAGVCVLSALLAFPAAGMAAMYRFSGGPSGGTFMYYANAITTLAKDNKLTLLASASNGSIENIRLVNSNRAQFAVAYSGDVFHARNGELKDDNRTYVHVLGIAYLYGAPAQLVVRADAGVRTSKDLVGKRVGVGPAGSGAAASAERYFTALGIWNEIKREFVGYSAAAEAFRNRQLDAFWIFAGFPNAAVIEAALQTDVKLISTYDDGSEVGFFEKFPYFTRVVIPAGTYRGQDQDVATFQDSTIWVAHENVPADVVYDLYRSGRGKTVSHHSAHRPGLPGSGYGSAGHGGLSDYRGGGRPRPHASGGP